MFKVDAVEMIFLGKKNIIKIIIIVWCVIWVNFIMRDLFRKGYIHDYKTLIKRDAEGKRAYTYGDYFYEFLKFAKSTIPQNSSYDFVGIEDYSLKWRRGIYFLYPDLMKENPDFLFVYKIPEYKEKNYILYAKLDDERFILKRK